MSRCPTCRFSNEDQAKVCIRCHTPLKKRRVTKVQLSVPEQKPIQRNPSPNVSPDTQRQLQSESKQELLVRLKKRISRYIPDGLTVEDALSRVVVPQKTSQDDTVFIEKNIFSPANLFFHSSASRLNQADYLELKQYAEEEKRKFDADQEEKRKREQKEQGIVAVADTAIVSVNSSPLSFSAAAQEKNNRIHLPLQFTYDHRPTIPITLRFESTTVECQALIDSGATHTIFHASLAQALGVEIPNKPKGRFEGISDKSITYFEATIEIGVGDLFYSTPVCFSDDLNPNAKNMLGQIGFFDRFTVEFEGKTVLVKEKHIGIPLPAPLSSPKSLPHISTSILGRGINQETEQKNEVTIGDIERRGGVLLRGNPRTGKTTLLVNMILQDIENGHGLMFIDPHGDAIDDILKRLTCREKDVILFDPFDRDYAFGLNLFECDPTDRRQVTRTVNYVLHMFAKLFTEKGDLTREAPTMDETMQHTAELLIDNQDFLIDGKPLGMTMAEIPWIFNYEEARQRLTPQLTDDHEQASEFWREYEKDKREEQKGTVASTKRRISKFLSDPHIKHIVGQDKSTIDFRSIIDKKKILLVKLTRDDEQLTNFIGSILIGKLLNTIYSDTTPEHERVDFAIYCDEFQNFATPEFAKLFTETGKWHIMPTISNQVGMLIEREIRGSIATAAIKVLYQLTEDDAQEFASGLAKKPPPAETRREPVLTPVVQPIEWLLGARGGQDNPVINNFVHTRLTVFGDAIKKSHQTVVRIPPIYGIELSHVSVPVSGLDLVRRELNRIFYEVMVEKNPRKIIPIVIFFPFAEHGAELSFPHLHTLFFDFYMDAVYDILGGHYHDILAVAVEANRQQLKSEYDISRRKAEDVFPLLWTSKSEQPVKKTVQQIYNDCCQLKYALCQLKIAYNVSWVDDFYESRIEYAAEKTAPYIYALSEAETKLSYIETWSYEVWLKDTVWDKNQALKSWLRKEVEEAAKGRLNNPKDKERIARQLLEERKDGIEEKRRNDRLSLASLESELREIHKTIQLKKEERQGELSLLLLPMMSEVEQEIRDFEALVFELREFMQALADDPIKDTSRYKEKETATRTEQDMWNEMVREFVNLPRYRAYCRMVQEVDGEQVVLKYKLYPYPLPQVDSKAVYQERNEKIVSQTRQKYCRSRKQVDEEIKARKAALTAPIRKQARSRQEDDENVPATKLSPAQQKKLQTIQAALGEKDYNLFMNDRLVKDNLERLLEKGINANLIKKAVSNWRLAGSPSDVSPFAELIKDILG